MLVRIVVSGAVRILNYCEGKLGGAGIVQLPFSPIEGRIVCDVKKAVYFSDLVVDAARLRGSGRNCSPGKAPEIGRFVTDIMSYPPICRLFAALEKRGR